MREILFRGKRKDNGERIYGFAIFADNKAFILNNAKVEFVKGFNENRLNFILIEVIPETVGQFTGLYDATPWGKLTTDEQALFLYPENGGKRSKEDWKGRRIFEGDILKQKTTTEFAKVNSFEWERYGIVRFGYCDWNEGEAGYASEGWYIEPLKSVSIKPKNYLVGDIQSGLNQCDIHDKYYPMKVIGNIHDNPELLEGGTANG